MMQEPLHILSKYVTREWFPGEETARRDFARIAAMCETYRRSTDTFSVPDIDHPWSAQMLHDLYAQLEQRGLPAPKQTASERDEAAYFAALNDGFGSYEINLGILRDALRGGNYPDRYMEFLGLEEGDLGNPKDENGARHPDWQRRAYRCRDAVQRWRGMPEQFRWLVPALVSLSRQGKAIERVLRQQELLSERITRLEKEIERVK